MANTTAVYKRSNGTKVSVNTMNENHIQAVLTNYVNGNNPRGRKTTWMNSDGKRLRISEMPVQYLRNALASIVTPAGNLTSKNRNFHLLHPQVQEQVPQEQVQLQVVRHQTNAHANHA